VVPLVEKKGQVATRATGGSNFLGYNLRKEKCDVLSMPFEF